MSALQLDSSRIHTPMPTFYNCELIITMVLATRPAIHFLQIDILVTARPIIVVVPSLLAVFVAKI